MSEDIPLVVTLRDGSHVALYARRQREGQRFIRVPWSILDSEMGHDHRALGRWFEAQLQAERLRPLRRPRIADDIWIRILVRFGFRCAYCGAEDVELQREHVIPWSKGGPTDETNIVPACAPCNLHKGTATWPVVWP